MALPILNLSSTLRLDPTRTTTLRARYVGEMNRRFGTVRAFVRKAIVDLDVLGLKEKKPLSFNESSPTIHALPEREAFRFLPNSEKVTEFNRWLQTQIDGEILTTTATGNPWTSKYIHSAYKQGSLRAYMDSHPEALQENLDFYKGRREQFLESAFNQPERLSKLRLLYTRSYEDLRGITNAMAQQISRDLADGLAQGLNPNTIARTLTRDIDSITRTRARTMARTEVIHAHAEGQLDSFEELGVQELQVMAEWSTAGDDRVCPRCAPLDGVVMTVEEARGLIPRHPNCRCSWIPANVGEMEARRKRYWNIVDKKKQVNKSLKAELPKKTRAGEKVPQTVREAKRRSTWPGKDRTLVKPPAGVDLDVPVAPRTTPPAPKTPAEWEKSLTEGQREAIREYTGGGYFQDIRRLNTPGMEHLVEDPARALRTTRQIDAALKTAPVQKGTVYRGLKDLSDDALETILQQDIVEFPSFASTSRSVRRVTDEYLQGKRQVMYVIKSHRGVNVQPVSLVRGEQEVLLPRGSRFKVVHRQLDEGFKKATGGERWKVFLEEEMKRSGLKKPVQLKPQPVPKPTPPKPKPAPKPKPVPKPRTPAAPLKDLENMEVVSRTPLQQGTSAPERVVLKDGTTGLWKPGSLEGSVRNERVAYEISRSIGDDVVSVPRTVRKTIGDKEGSFQVWVKGKPAAEIEDYTEKLVFGELVPPKQMENARVFDYILGAQDRHAGNFIIEGVPGKGARLHLIDNEYMLSERFTPQTLRTEFKSALRKKDLIPKGTKEEWAGHWEKIQDVLEREGVSGKSLKHVRKRYKTFEDAETWGDLL